MCISTVSLHFKANLYSIKKIIFYERALLTPASRTLRSYNTIKPRSHLAEYCFRLFTIETIEQSQTIRNRSARQSFLSKRNRYHPYNILKYLRISRKLFSFCLINPQLTCSVRKLSVKCSETVVMNLYIIGNIFGNIRI